MQAGYSVELGADDPALELPWASDDGSASYLDLKLQRDLVDKIPEAVEHAELSAFLTRINAPAFPLETAKCDAWADAEMTMEDEVFGAARKHVSYVDLLFRDDSRRFSLEIHEQFVKELSKLLQRAPEMPGAAEFIIRHCHYHLDGRESDSRIGFCITAYVTGYGDSQQEAVERWGIALKLLQNALVQRHSQQ